MDDLTTNLHSSERKVQNFIRVKKVSNAFMHTISGIKTVPT